MNCVAVAAAAGHGRSPSAAAVGRYAPGELHEQGDAKA